MTRYICRECSCPCELDDHRPARASLLDGRHPEGCAAVLGDAAVWEPLPGEEP